MSVRLSDYGVDESEWNPAERWPEMEWPENPYQAVADAQVRAGAWPGTPLLLEAASCYAGAATQSQSQEDSQQEVPATSPWDFLFEFSAPEKMKSGCGSSSLESTDDSIDCLEPQESSESIDGSGSTALYTEGESSSSRGGWKLSHRAVPRATDFVARYGEPPQQYCGGKPQQGGSSSSRSGMCKPGEVTTLMIRHIPNVYTRSMLVKELDCLGLGGLYDFLYLPIDKSTQWNVGYAFVNFVNPAAATKCVHAMTDYVFCCFEHNSGKVTQVAVAHIQGLERNLEYYSNTAVQCVGSQTNRPLVLATGQTGASSSGSGPRRRRRQRPGRLRQSEDSAHDRPKPAAADAGSADAVNASDAQQPPWGWCVQESM